MLLCAGSKAPEIFDGAVAIRVMADITTTGTGITRPLAATVRCKRFLWIPGESSLPYGPEGTNVIGTESAIADVSVSTGHP